MSNYKSLIFLMSAALLGNFSYVAQGNLDSEHVNAGLPPTTTDDEPPVASTTSDSEDATKK